MKQTRTTSRRSLSIYFYTSSVDKLLQARTVFGRFGIPISYYRGKKEPYDEDYRLGTDGMLRAAVEQIRLEFGLGSVFFVEDTSLRIEALSDTEDFPRLQVKEWFSGVTFKQLDEALKGKGGERRAVIKSDIALSLPGILEPTIFHGETSGKIGDVPPSFKQSAQYPWLSPDNFNGWFIPDGSTKRLGEMEFEESLEYDFPPLWRRITYQMLHKVSALAGLRRLRTSSPVLDDLGVCGSDTRL